MIKKLVEKLLYWPWRGQSTDEAEKEVRQTHERVENRRKMRINVDADITVSSPSAEDFDRWLNLRGGEDEENQ